MSVGAALAENEKKSGSTEATEVGRSKWAPYALLTPGGLWLVIFFVVPTLVLLSMSLQTGSLDAGYVMSWHFSTYSDAITQYWPEFLRSFIWAGIATTLCLLIGYPLAYTIAFRAGRWKNAMLVLVIAPFFTSFLIRTLAWETILSDNGPVVSVMNWLHITNALTFVGLGYPGRVLNTPIAVIMGLTYNFLPFMVLPLYASLDRMDPRLVEAGQDLYCSPWRAFRKITFPLSLPGVVAGTLLTFIPATGDYINSTLLGDTGQPMIGNVIDSQFFQVLDYPTASALSFILMAAILVLVLLYVRQAGTEELV